MKTSIASVEDIQMHFPSGFCFHTLTTSWGSHPILLEWDLLALIVTVVSGHTGEFSHLFMSFLYVFAAPQVENVQLAIQHIWPLVYKYRMENESLTAEEVSKTQMFVMPGNNTRVSLYNKKRRKAIRSRCAKFLDEDSDGENWSDSSENCESEEPGIDEEEEEEQYWSHKFTTWEEG